MTSFSIRESGFKEIKRKLLTRYLLSMAVGIVIFAGISFFNNNIENRFDFWPYYLVFLVVMIGFQANRYLKKTKALLSSYRLCISDDGVITREQLNLNPLSISAIEISEISRYKNGSFCIRGLTKADAIFVPAKIEHAQLLETELNKLHPVTILTGMPIKQKLSIALAVTVFVSMLCTLIATNKWVVAVSGVLFIGTMGYALAEMKKSKNIPDRVKRGSWVYVIVLIAVLLNILTKMFGVNI